MYELSNQSLACMHTCVDCVVGDSSIQERVLIYTNEYLMILYTLYLKVGDVYL